MSNSDLKILIDDSFNNEINISIPSFKKLINYLKDNIESFDYDMRDYFYNLIIKKGRMNELQLQLLNKIFNLIINEYGESDIPFKNFLDGSITALRILAYLLPNLSDVNKKFSVNGIYNIIITYDTKHKEYKILRDALINSNSQSLQNICLSNLEVYDHTILTPVYILSKIGDESVCKNLLEVLKTSMIDDINYGGYRSDVQSYIIEYLIKIPCQNSEDILYNLLIECSGSSDVLTKISKALYSIKNLNVNKYYNFIKNNITSKKLIVESLIKNLSELEENKLNIFSYKELFSIIHPKLNIFHLWDGMLYDLTLKMEIESMPILKTMLNSDGDRDYKFARECLIRMGKNVNDYLEENIFLKTYELLNVEATHPMGFKDIIFNKKHRTDNIKQIQLFEYGILNLFDSCGFSVILLDPHQIEGIDIFAYSSQFNEILLIDCTTGILTQDKVNRIYKVTQKIKSNLPKYVYNIYSIICTNDEERVMNRNELMETYSKEVGVLYKEKLEKIYNLMKSNRTHREILDFIRNYYRQPL